MARVRRIGSSRGSLRDLKARLRTLPQSTAYDVAQQVAPRLTSMAQDAYRAGRTVYGEPRPQSPTGRDVDLVRTGATLRMTRFRASGSVMVCSLGTPYAKYLVGRYRILPVGDRTGVPIAWQRVIEDAFGAALERRAAQ